MAKSPVLRELGHVRPAPCEALCGLRLGRLPRQRHDNSSKSNTKLAISKSPLHEQTFDLHSGRCLLVVFNLKLMIFLNL